MIHLTFTGVLAGLTYCGKARSEADTYHHAAYAPLDNPQYRDQVCPDCLKFWENEE